MFTQEGRSFEDLTSSDAWVLADGSCIFPFANAIAVLFAAAGGGSAGGRPPDPSKCLPTHRNRCQVRSAGPDLARCRRFGKGIPLPGEGISKMGFTAIVMGPLKCP